MVGTPNHLTKKLAVFSGIVMISLTFTGCQKEATPSDNEVSDNSDSFEVAEETGTAISDRSVSDDSVKTSATDTTTDITAPTPAEEKMATLSKYRWILTSATDANGQPLADFLDDNTQMTLLFTEYQGQPTLSYSAGCNTISAFYQIQGQTLTTENDMGTKMSCDDLDTAENRLNVAMQDDSEIHINQGDNLEFTQITDENNTLMWHGRLLPQAKYNSKGETVFWAINAKNTPCLSESSKQCLQIKPIIYNDQGIKTREGAWRPFAGNIEGYQHNDRQEEVLRLQRYELNNKRLLATSEQQYAYVLDAVIESNVTE